MRRYHSGCRCDCCLDAEDEVNELTDENEVLRKSYTLVHNAVYQGRYQDALAYIERILEPRWHSVDYCKQQYRLATAPPVKQGLWFYM